MTITDVATLLKEHGRISSVLDLGGADLTDTGYEVAREAEPGATFDAVLMTGTAFTRLATDEDLAAALDSAHRRLRPGGLLVAEVLDGSAVLRLRPGNDFSRVADGDGELVTAVLGTIDEDESLLCQRIRRWRLSRGQAVELAEETRRLRYFLPRELQLALDVNGFRLLDTAPLAEPRRLAVAEPCPRRRTRSS